MSSDESSISGGSKAANGNGSGSNGNGSSGNGGAARPPPPLLLRLPAFLFAVWLMYWSLPLGVLAGFIPVWQLRGPRNDTFYWCKFLTAALGIRFYRRNGSADLYRGPGPVMFLANHRSWADFFVDAYLAGGRAQVLSRLAVMAAFPMFMAPVAMMRGCIVFRRDRVRDKEAFNAWVDARVAASPQAGLLVYPEGHRSTRAVPLPLKRGMLHYAYSRRMPVQIIVSLNKESVVNERAKAARFGAAVVTSYAPVIKAADYGDFAGFMAAVQEAWDREWRATMGARAEGLPPLTVPGDIDSSEYPLPVLASQLWWGAATSLLLLLSTALSLRALAGATAWLGPRGQATVAAALLAWFAASMAACYDPTLPEPLVGPDGEPLRRDGGGGGSGAKATAAAAAAVAHEKKAT